MKLIFLIAVILFLAIVGFLFIWADQIDVRTLLGLECFGLAGFAASFLPIK
jgi:hypothetical protein